MSHPTPYFMHDQVRQRVALIMRGHQRTRGLAWPIWPLVAVIGTLTLVNLATAIPPL